MSPETNQQAERIRLLARREELKIALCQRSFHFFVSEAWRIVEPVVAFCDGRHVRTICAELQRTVEDPTAPDIVLNCPPGFMKSLLISVMFPAWAWGPGNRPDLRFLFATYNQTFGTRDAGNRRALLASRWYQERWGSRFALVDYQREKRFWKNDKGGFMRSITTGGGLGEHPDIAILDDVENVRMVMSKAYRRQVAEWIDATIGARGIARNVRRIIGQQRLHYEDASAHWLSKKLPVRHLCFPLRFDPQHPFRYSGDWRSTAGQLLWPELFDETKSNTLERSISPMWHAAQLDQNPQRRGGKVLKEEWLSYYRMRGPNVILALDDDGNTRAESDDRKMRRFVTIDTAETDKSVATAEHSYSAAEVWDYWPARNWLFLRHVWREQVGWDDLVDRTADVLRTWGPTKVIIEEKSFGAPLASRITADGYSVELVTPLLGKLSRSSELQTKLKAREVFLPYEDCDWLADLVQEWLDWTGERGEPSDQIDTASMAAQHVASAAVEVIDALPGNPLGWRLNPR